MKRFGLLLTLIIALTSMLALVRSFAQSNLGSLRYYAEIQSLSGGGFYDFLVPLQVMDQAQDQLGDLRLVDASGKEIPYALSVRRDVSDVRDYSGTLFNFAEIGGATSEVSVDLGEDVVEHNEVMIETSGTNFRRRVNIEGGDTGTDWKTLQSDGVIFAFSSANSVVESNRVSYPPSRYRYLRVRVIADEMTDRHAPAIANVKATRVVKAQGELANWNVPVPSFDSLRDQSGAPSSSWTIDLGGRVPCDRLTLDVAADSFSRKYQLETADDPQQRRLVASGELVRRLNEPRNPLVIRFDQEEHVRKLRLLVTDYSNATLPITAIMASAPARQVVFELKGDAAKPVKVFFGDYSAVAPHYDFEKDLSARISSQPTRARLGSFFPNPDYKPAPLPLTERVPWLIYLVLAASSIALALILLNLARSTLRTEPVESETGRG